MTRLSLAVAFNDKWRSVSELFEFWCTFGEVEIWFCGSVRSLKDQT